MSPKPTTWHRNQPRALPGAKVRSPRKKRQLVDGGKGYKKPANHAEHVTNIAYAGFTAAQSLEHLFESVHERFYGINQRLLEIHNELRAAQPKYEDAVDQERAGVALDLYSCGQQCLGCPHPRWMKYKWFEVPRTLANPKHKFKAIGHELESDPVLSISRKAANRELLLAMVREAKALIAERADLIAVVTKLRSFTKRERFSPRTA